MKYEFMIDGSEKVVYSLPAFPLPKGRLWSVIASVAQW